MSGEKLFIPVLLGTNRKERKSENAARWVFGKMQERAEIVTKFFDVRDFDFPTGDYGQALKDQFPEWSDAVTKADGFVFVVPEYNHGYPGIFKSVVDLCLKEYIHKAVAFVGVSAGGWGGTRVIEACVPMVRELGLAVTFSDLNFPKIQDKFDGEGNLTDEKYNKFVEGFLDELIFLSRALKWGRNNLQSKHH